MADKQEAPEEQEGEGKKGKGKLIIIIAVVAVLAIGISVGATLFLLGGDDAPVEEEPAEPVKLPAAYLDIKPPFLVTYNVGGRQRYLQVHLSGMSRDQSILDALELHMPLIRNKVISLYASEPFESLQTNEGKVALRDKTLVVINDILAAEEVEPLEAVYFSNFVMQ